MYVNRRHRVLLWVLTAAWKRLPLDRELDINVITTTTLLVLPSLPVIARVHPTHLVNVDWAPGGRQPLDQASRLGLQYAKNWQLSSTSTIAIVIITQPVSWYSFYRLMKGGRLSRPRHCSKGAQAVPKAVYRSSCHDKHNCPWCDLNLDPLTPWSEALTARLLRPAWDLNVLGERTESRREFQIEALKSCLILSSNDIVTNAWQTTSKKSGKKSHQSVPCWLSVRKGICLANTFFSFLQMFSFCDSACPRVYCGKGSLQNLTAIFWI